MESLHLTGQERRRHPRTHLQMSVHCVRLDPGGSNMLDQLEMFDISRSGIGAISQQSYYPGQRVVVRLPLSKADGGRNRYASVVRCRMSRDRGYEVGLQFAAADGAGEVDYRQVA